MYQSQNLYKYSPYYKYYSDYKYSSYCKYYLTFFWMAWGKAGMVTTAMVPWDIKTQSIDHNNSILTVKCNTFKPHPSIPDKAVIISLEINKMGGMPKWALKIIMSSTAPGLMSGLEKRYIQNVRKANKTMDMTPEGRKKRKKGAWEW